MQLPVAQTLTSQRLRLVRHRSQSWLRRAPIALAAITMIGAVASAQTTIPVSSQLRASADSSQRPSRTPIATAGASTLSWRGDQPDNVSKLIVIDGVSGTVSGDYRFAAGAPVRIVIRNMNPYLHQYRIRSEAGVLAEADPADYFQQAFGLSLPKPSAKAPVTTDNAAMDLLFAAVFDEEAIRSAARSSTAECTGTSPADAAQAIQVTRILVGMLAEARSRREPLETLFDSLAALARRTDAAYRKLEPILFSAERPASEVQIAAREALRALRSYRDTLALGTDSAQSLLAAYNVPLAQTSVRLKGAPEKYPGCHALADAAVTLAALQSDSAVYASNLATVRARRAGADTAVRRLEHAATDPGRFNNGIILPRAERGTEVTVYVERRGLGTDSAYRPVAQRRVNFGGRPRFHIGAGVTWSDLRSREFKKVIRYRTPSTPGGSDTLESIAAVSYNSSNRFTPMVLLHTRLADFGDRVVDGAHLTLGTGIGTNTANKGDIEYALGLSLSGLGERVVLTGGALGGRTQELAGGYNVGGLVPSSVSDVPVRTRFELRPAVGLSFNIR